MNWVNYPGLPDHPHVRARQEVLCRGRGRDPRLRDQGRPEAGVKFIDSLKLVSHLANIGDAKSLVIHPASTTHQQLTADEQLETGVTADFVRLSIGLEDSADIICRHRPGAGCVATIVEESRSRRETAGRFISIMPATAPAPRLRLRGGLQASTLR